MQLAAAVSMFNVMYVASWWATAELLAWLILADEAAEESETAAAASSGTAAQGSWHSDGVTNLKSTSGA